VKAKDVVRSLAGNSKRGDLQGGIVQGAYFTELSIGTPPQQFILDVDTGSSYTVLISKDCKQQNGFTSCASKNPGYNASASFTSMNVPCTNVTCACTRFGQCMVEVRYGDGSGALGWLMHDVVSISSLEVSAYFGSMYTEIGHFSSSTSDGILGMAYKSLSHGVPTFMDRLVETHKLDNLFSMCLGDEDGALVIGGIEKKYYTGDLVYTPIINETYYVVNLTSINIGTQRISTLAQAGKVVVDSGTTGIVVPTAIYSHIKSGLSSYCYGTNPPAILCGIDNVLNLASDKCLLFTDKELDAMPAIEFAFIGTTPESTVSVSISARDYLRYSIADGNRYCGRLGVYQMDDFGIILGDTFMRAFYTVFDKQHKKIGFAVAQNCGIDLRLAPFNWTIVIVVCVSIGFVCLGIVILGVLFFVRKARRTRTEHAYSAVPQRLSS